MEIENDESVTEFAIAGQKVISAINRIDIHKENLIEQLDHSLFHFTQNVDFNILDMPIDQYLK